MPSKEAAAACFLVLGLAVSLGSATTTFGAPPSSRFHIKRDRPPGILLNRRPQTYEQQQQQQQTASPRHDTGFDPDVLNRFLEEYASKIKRVGERPPPNGYEDSKRVQDPQGSIERHDEDVMGPNDSIKRHKYYGSGPQHQAEDRNSGWVTLDAIPWSKSKISKWQANPTTQGSWPGETKPWDNTGGSFNKPWNSEPPSRPSYEGNKPWQNKLTNRPYWSETSSSSSSSSSASNKPGWYSERPSHQDRPSTSVGYPIIDKYEDDPNQAQKWPPERPSWDRFGDSTRPSADIITDNGPSNFPINSNSNNNNNNNGHWDRPSAQRPSFGSHTDSLVNEAPAGGSWLDRNDFSSNQHHHKFPHHNSNNNNNNNGEFLDRPHFSQYQYPSSSSPSGGVGSVSVHPSSHPDNGDGKWVLLSTNRGYSKSRQRSIKLEAVSIPPPPGEQQQQHQTTNNKDERVPSVTSKRQVRLTVLAPIDGTNTTTSHGGLLEVEKTFKTVDQSQKEYELQRKINAAAATALKKPTVVAGKRPAKGSGLTGVQAAVPSNSAVLAAVGAGMLPATMGMLLPMMLGRKKREVVVPENLFDDEAWRRM